MQDRAKMRSLPLMAAVGLSVALAGCDEGMGPLGGARVNVYLTDAAGDVDKVWVQIDGVALVGDENGEVPLPGDFDDMIEVSSLVGQTQLLVNDADVEGDSFHQIRLLIGGAVLLTKDGDVYATDGAELPAGVSEADGELHCPSCSQSGLKIVVTGDDSEVEPGENVSYLLDFDIAQSFGQQAGSSGRWVMRPVVHATRVAVPSQPLAGSSISGTVALGSGVTIPACPAGTPRSLADFVPTATAATLKDVNNAAVVRSGTTTAGGAFSINNVAPDTYALGAMDVTVSGWKLTFNASAVPASTPVVQGQNVTGVAYTITGASCTQL